MKKVLLFLLCLVLITSFVEAKIIEDSIYQITKTKIAPTINGGLSAVWKTLDWNMQRIYWIGDPPVAGTNVADSGVGLTGLTKAMWDANNIYILIYSVDDVIIDVPTNPGWNQDAVEIYIDGTNNHTSEAALSPGQYQFTIPHWLKDQEVGNLGTAFGTAIDTTGIEFKIRDVSDAEGFPGFMTEVKIPLAALGIDGSSDNNYIGWELQQDESDDATLGRQSMSKWWSCSNNSWANAGLWGTAKLSAREIGLDTAFAMCKLPAGTTITVDGQMDPIYKGANAVTTNLFRVGDPSTAESPLVNTDPMFGSFITAYPVWDENNVYVFLDVVDPILVDVPTNPGWNQDAVELYFDGTNNHTHESGLAAGQYQFTIPHWLKGQEVGNLGTAFGTTIDTTGIEYKFADRDMRGNEGVLAEEGGGYNLEVKIPLAALGIDGTSPGSLLGFEVQMDNSSDATVGRGQMAKWWHNSNNSWADAGLWGTAMISAEPAIPPITSVKGNQSVVNNYRLEQNFPNPFNPATQISFTLAKSEKVKLTVYNLLGKEVAVLVNGMRSAGSQTVTFNANNLASGVYFYKLQAGSTVIAKKMMLLK
jgi:HAMP domain-containing protein